MAMMVARCKASREGSGLTMFSQKVFRAPATSHHVCMHVRLIVAWAMGSRVLRSNWREGDTRRRHRKDLQQSMVLQKTRQLLRSRAVSDNSDNRIWLVHGRVGCDDDGMVIGCDDDGMVIGCDDDGVVIGCDDDGVVILTTCAVCEGTR